jgi:hypothetical protein
MQRNAVPFGVEHNGAKAVRTDGMLGEDYLPAIRCDSGDGIIQSSLAIEIYERPMIRGFVLLGAMKAASDDFVSARQEAYCHPRVLLLGDWCAQHRGIETNGPIQIEHGDIHPYNLIHHDELHARGKGQGARHITTRI